MRCCCAPASSCGRAIHSSGKPTMIAHDDAGRTASPYLCSSQRARSSIPSAIDASQLHAISSSADPTRRHGRVPSQRRRADEQGTTTHLLDRPFFRWRSGPRRPTSPVFFTPPMMSSVPGHRHITSTSGQVHCTVVLPTHPPRVHSSLGRPPPIRPRNFVDKVRTRAQIGQSISQSINQLSFPSLP